jgi:8-oxo-dGTP pyrophosphatase MutT (NUDIX family)
MLAGLLPALIVKLLMLKRAGVMLIIQEGLILGISRRHNKTIFGLLGGKCDDKEEPLTAACRETYEEAGVIVDYCITLYVQIERGDGSSTSDDYESHCFYAITWNGTPSSREEGEVKWLTVPEITSTNAAFPDYNIRMLKVFRQKYPDVFLQGELI